MKNAVKRADLTRIYKAFLILGIDTVIFSLTLQMKRGNMLE